MEIIAHRENVDTVRKGNKKDEGIHRQDYVRGLMCDYERIKILSGPQGQKNLRDL